MSEELEEVVENARAVALGAELDAEAMEEVTVNVEDLSVEEILGFLPEKYQKILANAVLLAMGQDNIAPDIKPYLEEALQLFRYFVQFKEIREPVNPEVLVNTETTTLLNDLGAGDAA